MRLELDAAQLALQATLRDYFTGLVSASEREEMQVDRQVFVNEAARADVPLPAVTLQTVGPTLHEFGTAEQKEFFLPGILAGELHFAIGYTEPEAGTDLAALRTRAVRDG